MDRLLIFAPGTTRVDVPVVFVADRVAEANETFSVALSSVSGAGIASASATGTIVNDDAAPRAANDNATTNEQEVLTVAAEFGVLANDVDDDGDVLTATVQSTTTPAAGALVLASDGGFTFTPAADFAGTATFAIAVTDGVNSVETTLAIDVVNINDAPVVDTDIDVTVRAVEDVFDAPGSAVVDLFDAISDIDQGARRGLAIVDVEALAETATIELSTDGGVSFAALPAVSAATALTLGDDPQLRLRVVPLPGGNPVIAVHYVAWDQTDGVASGATIDTTTRGGASSLSSSEGRIVFSVQPINDAPTFTAPTPVEGDVLAAREGTEVVVHVAALDEDGPELSLSVDGLPGAATFTLDNNNTSNSALGVLRFTPTLADTGTHTITVTAADIDFVVERRFVIEVAFIDADGDLVADTIESVVGTLPGNDDSDDDTISDFVELGADPTAPPDTDGDGVFDALDDDSDGDGILDEEEASDAVLDTPVPDSDDDGATDQLDTDNDDDTILDGDDNCRINSNAEQADADGDLVGDGCDDDADGDRVLDRLEPALGLDATNPDTDGDTIVDGEEAPGGARRDTDGDGTIDALDDDSDDDGASDADEAGDRELGTAPRDFDEDGTADFIDTDSDGDTITDDVDNCLLTANTGQEDLDTDGNGDACVGRCGDGILHFGEECDDDSDRCADDCTLVCTPEVCDGIDNDCDGEVDLVRDGNAGLRSACIEDIELVAVEGTPETGELALVRAFVPGDCADPAHHEWLFGRTTPAP